MPYYIQSRLKLLRMTQRELLQELRKRGFSQLSEQLLSSILCGSYIETDYSKSIIETADEILKRRENNAKKAATNET